MSAFQQVGSRLEGEARVKPSTAPVILSITVFDNARGPLLAVEAQRAAVHDGIQHAGKTRGYSRRGKEVHLPCDTRTCLRGYDSLSAIGPVKLRVR